MLRRMQVRDFAIVDRIEVEFDTGMTVLTGETGAGKSILVDALGLVLGERGSSQLLRPGAKRAEFSAEFDLANVPAAREWLADQSLDVDNECLLRRVINADGRSRAFINGNAVPIQQLKTIGEYLVDIHGQHFHQSLGKKSVQRNLLDYFGGLLETRRQTAHAFEEWQALASRLEELTDARADRESRLDLLNFQLQELESLDLQPGETDALLEERARLQNSGKLADGTGTALDRLYDNDQANANQLLAEASRAIAGLVDYDSKLVPVSEMIESAVIQVSEAADSLQRYAENLDMDPARRDEVESRLDAIQALARKHRVEPGELLELQAKLAADRTSLDNAEAVGKELQQAVRTARSAYDEAAGALSAGRKNAAKKLSKLVTDAMHGLGMPGGRFDVSMDALPADGVRPHGVDEIGFRITANPGQPLMVLSKVASGGELSRMSLAIQVIASDGSAIPTMVFDEVDSGVGGSVAEMVGRRLAELGANRQVLCVTHLPQVASLADQQFRVAKVSDGKATRTSVQQLGREERVEELARMLGGVEITRKTLEHAAEMLADAGKKRA